ncbi:MAG TPA: chemotaxis protein CheW [Azospirillum sp.]
MTTTGGPTAEAQYVVFSVADRRLALPGGAVRRVVPMPRLERLPGQPPVLAGVAVLGGEAVPVLNLAALFGLPAGAPGVYTPLLLTEQGGRALALLVDAVQAVGPADGPILADADAGASFNGCVAGVWRRGAETVHVLDPARLLTRAEEERLAGFRAVAEERLRSWRGAPA